MNKKYLFFSLFIYIYTGIVNAITINLAGQSFLKSFEDLYALITREFNKYAKENDLDINLNFILFSIENTTKEWDSFDSAMHLLLQQKKTKYDMLIYDPLFTRRLSPHLVNLKDYLPKEHLDQYLGDAEKIGVYEDKWVGMPLLLKYTILYSNKILLNKYDEKIPKTWDQMLATGKRILEEERKNNNYDLIGFNGYYPKGESTMCSAYSFLYSYRDSKESPVPEINSKTAEEAFNMLLKIKNELSNDEVFSIGEDNHIMMLYMGTVIFSNFWDFDHEVPNYYMTPLPGKTEDVNGSCLGGYLLGINNYITNEKKRAASEVIKFLTSEYIQKEVILKQFKCFSALTKLYDDEEVCSYTDCELMKSIQGIERPSSKIDNYEDYSSKYTNLINDFLYNNKPLKEALTEIDDILKIYHFSQKTSTIALILFIIIQIIFCCVILMTALLFIPKFKKYFRFLSNDLWIMYVLGVILVISSVFPFFGALTSLKCFFNHIILSTGLNFILTPILYQLLINFPKINVYSEWLKKNKYLFIGLIEFINILIGSLLLLSPYKIKEIIIEEGKNYEKCQLDNKYGTVILIIQIGILIIKFLSINTLIYLEWNLAVIAHELKIIVIMMGMDCILIALYCIYKLLNITNYITYYTLYIGIIVLFFLTNHTYLFIIRIILSNKDGDDEMVMKIRQSTHSYIHKLTTSQQGNISKSSHMSNNTETETQYSNKSKTLTNILKIHESTSFFS
ncbi:periplasmic binding protein-like II [Piromyces finnis]|uniref:Periplasmic binding protein-like II n=1 Tax=Piromyces finnis TaxID=1754191 RepID=A0A1Y1UVT8_9FUNG|nr:periplasmic binding protein-like II [Piromyces finnis]|eukprot:ORX42187.1 periplasmic binding protein-like II [Piromyces finnis]